MHPNAELAINGQVERGLLPPNTCAPSPDLELAARERGAAFSVAQYSANSSSS
jgi:hypothetical protein